jgi:hypothetical protein
VHGGVGCGVVFLCGVRDGVGEVLCGECGLR